MIDPIFRKNQTMNDENVRWIGHHYDQDVKGVPELHLRFNSLFYKKCVVDHLTIKLGDYVLIANESEYDPTSLDKCNIAQIIYLYEDLHGVGEDNCRALVQWFARHRDLPKSATSDTSKQISEEFELVKDSRFGGDIAISSIFEKTRVEIMDDPLPSITSIIKLNERKGPVTYFCRYKLEKVSSKYYLYPLNEINFKTPKKTPSKVTNFTTPTKSAMTPNKLILSKLDSPGGKWTIKCEKLNPELLGYGKENETTNSPIKRKPSTDRAVSYTHLDVYKRQHCDSHVVL